MALVEYRRKRRFARSPEPRGKRAARGKTRSFVVQKHDARRLHYDFRLEFDGVLKSWAAPKGPSYDPHEKRLAVEVEDHPLEYAAFEGVIPEGEYGAGAVEVWDRGTWTPEEDPEEGLRHGKLKFRLAGEKLRGGWALVRMGGQRPDRKTNWLLIKERDDEARSADEYDVLAARPESVLSGRTIEEIAAGDGAPSKRRAANSPNKRTTAARAKGAGQRVLRKASGKTSGKSAAAGKAAAMPRGVELQLATLVKSAPEGDGWFHEIKLDGYRLLCRIVRGQAKFITRGEQDWTRRFATLAEAAEELPVKSAILDGEAVALLPDGASSFQALQNAFRGEPARPLAYFAFELLYLDGRDLRSEPLERRKALLAELLAGADPAGPLRLSEHIVGQGAEFFRQVCKRGLEGIVSKRRDRPYVGGRGLDWLKLKCIQRAEFVIGGFTDPERSRAGFGALLVGYHDDGKLVYAGRVGTGFSDRLLRELRGRLDRLALAKSPFQEVPRREISSSVHWVRPELVAQVEFSNWTDDGLLRQPSFQGLREDKPAADVGLEKAADKPSGHKQAPGESKASGRRRKGSAKQAAPSRASSRAPSRASAGRAETVDLSGVKLTHADRVLYPDQGLTKLDLAAYYVEIADWILPHVAGRPLSLVRCPEGRHKSCFYQKHVGPGAPAAIGRVKIEERGGAVDYAMIDDARGLIGLVQLGVLEIHPWGSRADNVERPDRLFFDLDPGPGVAWKTVIDAASRLRRLLEELDLTSFVKTTGGKGLHVVLPIQRRHDWPLAKAFAKAVAARLAREEPDRYLVNSSRSLRAGKIFIDYLRNDRGATAVAPYSSRARRDAPISVPIAWDELSERIPSDRFHVNDLPGWMRSLRRDPWRAMERVRQSITGAHRKELGL
jgi:bifunctional non-homologous end joining protein LigD